MLLEINQKSIEISPQVILQEYTNGTSEFNGQTIPLGALMQHLFPHSNEGLAVAIDDLVVSYANWSNTPVKENDKILILTASQGG